MRREIAVAAAALAAVVAGWALVCAAAPRRDGGVIRNSGSTNAAGYTIKVWSDGATWSVPSNRAGTQVGTPKTGSIPQSLAKRFLRDAQEAREDRAATEPCMKSASFGSTTTVLYHGWTSPDLECPPSGPSATALARDVREIVSRLGTGIAPVHRIPMLPNEPRRVPSDTPAEQPSAMPEPPSPAP